MTVDPFYAPFHRPTPRPPRALEPVWQLRKDHHTYSCELHDQGEWGVEAQIFRDGDLLLARRFDLRALAVQWAEEERSGFETGR